MIVVSCSPMLSKNGKPLNYKTTQMVYLFHKYLQYVNIEGHATQW